VRSARVGVMAHHGQQDPTPHPQSAVTIWPVGSQRGEQAEGSLWLWAGVGNLKGRSHHPNADDAPNQGPRVLVMAAVETAKPDRGSSWSGGKRVRGVDGGIAVVVGDLVVAAAASIVRFSRAPDRRDRTLFCAVLSDLSPSAMASHSCRSAASAVIRSAGLYISSRATRSRAGADTCRGTDL
jgi:hypothetical protein